MVSEFHKPSIVRDDDLRPTWVVFIASKVEALLTPDVAQNDARVSHYLVDEVVRVEGESPIKLVPGWRVVRIESEVPVQPSEESFFPDGEPFYKFVGVTENLHYTSAAQRLELETRSRTEFEPSRETRSVLIPIRKSKKWWGLAQDQRQVHFQTSKSHQGHTSIGLKYADRVFRRLYHSRYTNSPAPYDFLTYFEFQSSHEKDFRMLLGELRNTERNPEWEYVELEFEIWMTKVG